MVVQRAAKPHNSSGMVVFERDAFLRLLTTRVVGRRLEYHDRVPSTMGLADALLKLCNHQQKRRECHRQQDRAH